jgi:ribokinase
MTKNSILVVGSSNTDMIIKVQRIPKPGETILGGEFASAAGGKGANQAVGAARAGGTVTLIARVGQDMFGDKAVAGFIADGINVEYVVRDRICPSGVALIFVGQNGENSIAVASGANAKLAPADLRTAKSAFRQSSVVVLQLETPLKTVEAAVKMAAAAGARVILNPAPARPLPDDLLQGVYLLTPNESEAEMLTGMPVNDAAGRLIPPVPGMCSMEHSLWRSRRANRCWMPPASRVPRLPSRSPAWEPRLRLPGETRLTSCSPATKLQGA